MKPGDDGFQRTEVFQHSQLLSYINPSGDDSATRRVLGVAVDKDRGDDSVAYGIELLDGGHDGGSVPVSTLVPSRPHGAKTLMRDHTLEQFLKHFFSSIIVRLMRTINVKFCSSK